MQFRGYRETTENHAKTAGVMLPVRFCIKCKKYRLLYGGSRIKGTSRHNPSKFICGECNGNNARTNAPISEG